MFTRIFFNLKPAFKLQFSQSLYVINNAHCQCRMLVHLFANEPRTFLICAKVRNKAEQKRLKEPSQLKMKIIMPAQLGYWAIRGLAQPIRLFLSYVGEDFEDVLYKLGDGPEFSREEWLSVKYTLGLDFPNLPYYIDDDVKLTQTNAILRYLARKHNLYGETEKEQTQIDVLLDEIKDLRLGFANFCYGSGYNDKKEKYVEQTKPKLEKLEKYLVDKQFFIGDKVTVCDFHIYEILDIFKVFEPKLLAYSPKLEEYHERFAELPAIKAYINSEKFISRPIHNMSAYFF